jgi:hypothetical protein
VLVGKTGPVETRFRGEIDEVGNVHSGQLVWENDIGIFRSGLFLRNFEGGQDRVLLWTGSWEVNPNSQRTFDEVYLTALPTSVALPTNVAVTV